MLRQTAFACLSFRKICVLFSLSKHFSISRCCAVESPTVTLDSESTALCSVLCYMLLGLQTCFPNPLPAGFLLMQSTRRGLEGRQKADGTTFQLVLLLASQGDRGQLQLLSTHWAQPSGTSSEAPALTHTAPHLHPLEVWAPAACFSFRVAGTSCYGHPALPCCTLATPPLLFCSLSSGVVAASRVLVFLLCYFSLLIPSDWFPVWNANHGCSFSDYSLTDRDGFIAMPL